LCGLVNRRQACNLSFHQRQLDASDARGFTRTVNSLHGGLLEVIHLHEAIGDRATQQRLQFNVGHQMKPASEIFARDDSRLAAS
jgi:hypothetical protein